MRSIMISLRKITHQNLCACIYDIHATPYAVYDDDTMVGFVMYTYGDKHGGDFEAGRHIYYHVII